MWDAMFLQELMNSLENISSFHLCYSEINEALFFLLSLVNFAGIMICLTLAVR